MTSISTEQFSTNPQEALKFADSGPVLVLEGDIPKYVLLTHKEFERLEQPRGRSLAERLAMPEGAAEAVDFEIPQMSTVRLVNSFTDYLE